MEVPKPHEQKQARGCEKMAANNNFKIGTMAEKGLEWSFEVMESRGFYLCRSHFFAYARDYQADLVLNNRFFFLILLMSNPNKEDM